MFVIGAPCSGRDLVDMTILNLHDDAKILGHTDFPLFIYDSLRLVPDDRMDERWSIHLEDVWRHKEGAEPVSPRSWIGPFGIHNLRRDGVDPIEATRSICESMWDAWCPNVLVFGDSSQSYCFRHQELRKIFPEAKFIVVHRELEVNVKEYTFMLRGYQGLAEDQDMRGRIIPGCHRQQVERLKSMLPPIAPAFHVDLRVLKTWPERVMDDILDYVGLSHDGYGTTGRWTREAVLREIVRLKHLDCTRDERDEEYAEANYGLLGLRE